LAETENPISHWVPKHKPVRQFTASNSYAPLCAGIELEVDVITIPSAVEVSMTEDGVRHSLDVLLVFVNLFKVSGDIAINHDGQVIPKLNGVMEGK
jgi:hypothetical protein